MTEQPSPPEAIVETDVDGNEDNSNGTETIDRSVRTHEKIAQIIRQHNKKRRIAQIPKEKK